MLQTTRPEITRACASCVLETLDARRLLSTVDLGGGGIADHVTHVTEYDIATGQVTTLAADQRINDADEAFLDDYLKGAGFDSLSDFLDSLGDPDDFMETLDGIAGGSRDGHNPSNTRIYLPSAKGVGPGRSVEPPDDRVQITDTLGYPFSAVGRLSVGCSGAMIGPFHFLTAGHCVTNGSNFRPASSMQVSLGQDGDDRPFGVAQPTFVRTYQEWFNGDIRHDWAVITLDRNIGDYAGHLGYRWYNGQDAIGGKDVSILQYPGDKPFGTQWLAEGQAATQAQVNTWRSGSNYDTTFRTFYRGTLDTAGGSSGSSVWEMQDTDDMPMVLAVHGYGGAGTTGGYNGASRITERKFNDLDLWQVTDQAARAPVDKADLAPVSAFMPNSPAANVVSPNPVPVNGQLDLSATIRNFGTATANDVTVDVYLSLDSNITTGDILLGSAVFDSIDPFVTASEPISVGLPDTIAEGEYTIGFIIDGANIVDEFIESNNVSAVDTLVVGIGDTSGGGSADRFEPNNSFDTATGVGTLGDLVLSDLSIHNTTDDDYFRFTADASGNANITLLFSDAAGDIDARVFNSNGDQLASGTSSTDNETLNFSVVAGQDYVLYVYGWNGAINTYSANFNLPGNSSGGPSPLSKQFVWQAAQQFTFVFDQGLSLDTVDVGHVVLQNLTTGQTIDAATALNFAAGGNSLSWASKAVLPDGNYRATIPAGAIQSASGAPTVDDAVLDFFILAGDANRDRVVDLQDFVLLRNGFGRAGSLFSTGDFNYDGTVNLDDFVILRNSFGNELEEPGSLF